MKGTFHRKYISDQEQVTVPDEAIHVTLAIENRGTWCVAYIIPEAQEKPRTVEYPLIETR